VRGQGVKRSRANLSVRLGIDHWEHERQALVHIYELRRQFLACLANYRRGEHNAGPARQGYAGGRGRGAIPHRRGIPSIIYWRVFLEGGLGEAGESQSRKGNEA
jgi:hypothetical protein